MVNTQIKILTFPFSEYQALIHDNEALLVKELSDSSPLITEKIAKTAIKTLNLEDHLGLTMDSNFGAKLNKLFPTDFITGDSILGYAKTKFKGQDTLIVLLNPSDDTTTNIRNYVTQNEYSLSSAKFYDITGVTLEESVKVSVTKDPIVFNPPLKNRDGSVISIEDVLKGYANLVSIYSNDISKFVGQVVRDVLSFKDYGRIQTVKTRVDTIFGIKNGKKLQTENPSFSNATVKLLVSLTGYGNNPREETLILQLGGRNPLEYVFDIGIKDTGISYKVKQLERIQEKTENTVDENTQSRYQNGWSVFRRTVGTTLVLGFFAALAYFGGFLQIGDSQKTATETPTYPTPSAITGQTEESFATYPVGEGIELLQPDGVDLLGCKLPDEKYRISCPSCTLITNKEYIFAEDTPPSVTIYSGDNEVASLLGGPAATTINQKITTVGKFGLGRGSYLTLTGQNLDTRLQDKLSSFAPCPTLTPTP